MLLAIAAEKFGCRPSQMVGLEDAVLALDFDLAATVKLLEVERSAGRASIEEWDGGRTSGLKTQNVQW